MAKIYMLIDIRMYNWRENVGMQVGIQAVARIYEARFLYVKEEREGLCLSIITWSRSHSPQIDHGMELKLPVHTYPKGRILPCSRTSLRV